MASGGAGGFTRRVGNKLRREAQGLLEAGPPSRQLLRPIGPQVPSDARVQQVLDLCMQIGEVLLSTGESADETTRVMLRVASACGLPTVDVDITLTSITMCCHRGMAAAPVTTLRLIQQRTLDLTRLAHVIAVVERVESGELDADRAARAVAEAVRATHPYPRWIATAGWAGLAASVALLVGANAVTALVAFTVTAVIDRLGRVLGRWGLPAFFLQVVGGAVATGVALALFGLGAFPDGTQPSLVVAASITVLLSGLSVVGSVQDAIRGYYVTAAGRMAEIALLSAGLLTGVVLALKVGATFDVVLRVADPLPITAGRVWVGLAAAAAAAATFSVAGYARPRSLLYAALAGAAGWGSFTLFTQAFGAGPVAATGGAAVVIGLGTGLLRRAGGVNPLVVTLAGITPLLPGLLTYRGFYQLAVEGVSQGLVTVVLALGTGLALAAGVALGDFLAAEHRRPDAVHGASGAPLVTATTSDGAATDGAGPSATSAPDASRQ